MIVSLSLYFSCSSMKPGISALHGPHHVAQKFSSTTLFGSFNDASVTSLPSRFLIWKACVAGFASARLAAGSGLELGAGDAAGVAPAGVADAASTLSSGFQTNGMLIASNATAVIAIAIMRMLLLCAGGVAGET